MADYVKRLFNLSGSATGVSSDTEYITAGSETMNTMLVDGWVCHAAQGNIFTALNHIIAI